MGMSAGVFFFFFPFLFYDIKLEYTSMISESIVIM